MKNFFRVRKMPLSHSGTFVHGSGKEKKRLMASAAGPIARDGSSTRSPLLDVSSRHSFLFVCFGFSSRLLMEQEEVEENRKCRHWRRIISIRNKRIKRAKPLGFVVSDRSNGVAVLAAHPPPPSSARVLAIVKIRKMCLFFLSFFLENSVVVVGYRFVSTAQLLPFVFLFCLFLFFFFFILNCSDRDAIARTIT